jgi:hypothetical protein
MTYFPSFIDIGRGVTLKACFRNLRGCNVGITDLEDI